MNVNHIELALRKANIAFCRTDQDLIVPVKGPFRTYDMRCRPFQTNEVRVQVWFPPCGEVDLVEIKLLCSKMKESWSNAPEFGFYPELRTLCFSTILELEGFEEELPNLAEVCDGVATLLDVLAAGKPCDELLVDLAFRPVKIMFNA